jgi:hypothetical protein
MRATPFALSIFPLTLVGIMAAERSALLWLGANPGNPAAWEAWLGLHSTFGRVWHALATALGEAAPTHLLGLLVVAAVVLLATKSRRWPTYSFLGNHAALIVAMASSLLGAQATVSSLDTEFLSPSYWAVSWVSQLSSIQLTMFMVGTMSCLFCHVAVLRSLKARYAPISLQLKMLQQNL